ncbi:hypothetical protein PC9H_009870 [Pleurotus ostreatus]|uniref:Large ribosomal subunit protein uL30m n=2 Tax=Pleurotus ostreatus TaxID=5322 RepID=A0A067NMG9_PLEO1|nr:uncharacterized protein PC9H_009870 [Pleurotus ostreatus]KAF7424563.1 hypothetical protein PC9H_009870 [Pleurotus ostreatus]KDQ24786.1 hypothetical protein PLEOSDRAFT_1047754 [Pleurotus ostreatus PC15]
MQALAFKRLPQLRLAQSHASRSMSSAAQIEPPSTSSSPPTTHFKITLRRSAIGLGDRIKGTLVSLGIHRRHQTVYHPHGPEVAGKLLAVKELIDVENVPTELVKTKEQQTRDRRPPRGYQVVGNRRNEPLIA